MGTGRGRGGWGVGDLAAGVWIFYIVYQLLTLHNSEAVIHNSLLCKHRAYQTRGLNIFVLEGLIFVSYSGIKKYGILLMFFINMKWQISVMECTYSERSMTCSFRKKHDFVKRLPDFGRLSKWENNEDEGGVEQRWNDTGSRKPKYRGKSYPISPCPAEIPCELSWEWIQVCDVMGRGLATWNSSI